MNAFLPFEKAQIEQSISKRFEHQVCRFPDKIAVKTTQESLTYEELNSLSNQISQLIIKKCGKGTEPVALFFDQSAILIAAILGILKAGKIYVPLDPNQLLSRNKEILIDSTASLILTDTSNFDKALESATRDILVLDVKETVRKICTNNLNLSVTPDKLAYIFYTSGSTGRSKGLADTHRNVLHNIMRYTNNLQISADDRLTLLQSCSFSGSVSSLFCALLNGATSFPFSFPREGSNRLASWISEEKITIYHSVPSIFRLIATGKYQYHSMRVIRLEGDQASPRDLELYKRFFPKTCILVNGLGATECGIVRQYFVDKQTPLPDRIVPVGYPVADMEIILCNESKQSVGINCIGEITVRSCYLAPGYWRRPDLTKAVFESDPKGGDERLYRTGDLGRMQSDGCLEYLGRKNFRLKIRGRWVEIPEVEKALHAFGAFKDVVVMTRKDPGFEARLVAYLVPGIQPPPQMGLVRNYLSKCLPEHMIPSAFVVLEEIPLNSFGKVDRNALPAPSQVRPDLTASYIAPQNLTQLRLRQIWEEVVQISPIGIRDNFFELGGDSLLAAQLFDLIETQNHWQQLPLATLIQAPTIEQMADLFDRKKQPFSWYSLVPIQPRGIKPPFFCVHAHGGNVVGYHDLAYHLGQDQPFYGLQAKGLNGEPVGLRRFENMAADYIKEIRSVQPKGPYFIGGFCLGGSLAFEMAQQFQGQGDEVALAVMIEASYPDYPQFLPGTTPLHRLIYRIMDRVQLETTTLIEVKPGVRLAHMMKKLKRVLTIAQIKSEKKINPFFHRLGFNVTFSQASKLEALGEAHNKASRNYRPRPYQGRVVLIRSAIQPTGICLDSTLGWGGLIGKLEIEVVPGHRVNMLREPYVRITAKKIKDHLEKASHRASVISQAF